MLNKINKKIIRQNILVFILSFFILISFFYLALLEKKQQDLDWQKNWWSLYFNSPKGNGLDFTIENHSESENFHWEVYLEKSKSYEGNSTIPKGDKKSILVNSLGLNDKKVVIKVTSNDKNKEIYKIISTK